MSYFSDLSIYPEDVIFQIQQDFIADPRAEKINLGIGMYHQENGQSYLFKSVELAQKELASTPKDYLPIRGKQSFLEKTQKLIFDHIQDPIVSIQTAGATGALYLIGSLLKNMNKPVLIPSPTWSNHHLIFSSLGLSVETYPYFDYGKHDTVFDQTFSFLKGAEPGSILLLHGCCHNPTGLDFSKEELKELLAIAKEKKFFVIFDMAYHGLGQGLEKDKEAVQLFFSEIENIALTYSYSKNLGLYGERTGALFVKTPYEKQVSSHLARFQRTTISNPPLQGCGIVDLILQEPNLEKIWIEELDEIRLRLISLRTRLYNSIKMELGEPNWIEVLQKQHGLFALLPLSKQEVRALRDENGLYLPDNGRINLSSLNEQNFEHATKSFCAILKKV